MYRPLNDVYLNEILTVYMDTTPAYVLDDVIGGVETLSTNVDFRVKSILTSKWGGIQGNYTLGISLCDST